MKLQEVVTQAVTREEKTLIMRNIEVLLIEDNIGDARLVKEYLSEEEEYTFDITFVDSLAQGLVSLKMKNFDVIILDLSLPDCIGAKTFKTIHDYAPSTPVIILTGSVMAREDLRYCLDTAYSYIVKGYLSTKTLPQTILSAIQRQQAYKRISKHFVVS